MASEALQKLIDSKVAIPRRFSEYLALCPAEDLEPGDRWYMGHVYPVYGDQEPEIYELDGPWGGSDYSGDDVTESNRRSLIRDYPESFIDLYGGHDSYGLALLPKFDDEELAEILVGLKQEYPLYDEQDNGALIQERAEESWDSWLRLDLQSDVCDHLGASWVDLSEHEPAVWELMAEHDAWPEAEGHRDVIFPGIKDAQFLSDLAAVVIAAGEFREGHYGTYSFEADELTNVGRMLVGTWLAKDLVTLHPDQIPLFDLA